MRIALFALLCLSACSADYGTSDVNVQGQSLTTAVYQIDCGGGAVSPFAADQFATGGTAWTSTSGAAVATAGVANAAPAAVYQTERYGAHSYTFGSLPPNASYTVRLHFAEIFFNSAGSRQFNVLVNGVQVLTNLDIFATVGINKALVRDFTTSASSAGQITIQYVNVIQNAKSSAIEILSNSGAGNVAPTVATAAAANPNPATGTTSALSVLGADDGGEANLTYTWATTGTPPAPVSFAANGTNAAKNTTAAFRQAGSYALAVTIRDANGATATSSTSVVVSQTLTSIIATPATAQVAPSSGQQFSASARDQFGIPMATQPTATWAVSGGGTINASGLFTAGSSSGGPFTVSAATAGKTGTASVTVSGSSGGTTAVYQIDCGGGAVSPFAADQFATGGTAWTSTSGAAVATAGVANAAPAAAYQTERYGAHSYTFGSLTPNASYTVRLHFAEIFCTSAGSRQFNVLVNGVQVLTNLDIFATVGINKALVRDFTTAASSAGQITIQYVNVIQNAKSSAIEILANGGANNVPPTIAQAAGANPNPSTGTTSALSVLGADDGGEANLIYTWATTGTPPGPVSFAANGTNAAKNTTATFSQAGSYALAVTIRDANGATATSSTSVVVSQTLTSIIATPATAQVAPNGGQQFTASARDQFGTPMVTQPTATWAVNGGGSIGASGLFTAGSSSGGPFTVSATSGGRTGNASVTVSSAPFSYSTNFDLTETRISEGGTWKHLGLDWAVIGTTGGLGYGTQSGADSGLARYSDSYAYLQGFSPNVSVSTVIHKGAIGAGNHETAILLRWSDSAHVARGYECGIAFNGAYGGVTRWNGALGDFSSVPAWQFGGVSVNDGDVLNAQIVGNIISMRLNGALLMTADITTAGGGAVWTDGGPGFSCFRGSPSSDQTDFSVTSFSATSLAQ